MVPTKASFLIWTQKHLNEIVPAPEWVYPAKSLEAVNAIRTSSLVEHDSV